MLGCKIFVSVNWSYSNDHVQPQYRLCVVARDWCKIDTMLSKCYKNDEIDRPLWGEERWSVKFWVILDFPGSISFIMIKFQKQRIRILQLATEGHMVITVFSNVIIIKCRWRNYLHVLAWWRFRRNKKHKTKLFKCPRMATFFFFFSNKYNYFHAPDRSRLLRGNKNCYNWGAILLPVP